MSYYRTNDPSVLSAVAEFKRQKEALQATGQDFARKFGGKAVFTSGFTHYSFCGVKFTPQMVSPLWTKPDRNSGTQRPRAKVVTGATAEQKAELTQLHADWNAAWPDMRVERDVLYGALGTNWGDILFAGIAYFEGGDGYFYVETGAKLGDHMEEIKGSEYMLAKEAVNERKGQA